MKDGERRERAGLAIGGLDAESLKGVYDKLLEEELVVVEVAGMRGSVEVNDWVENELAGPVIGGLTTALRKGHRERRVLEGKA